MSTNLDDRLDDLERKLHALQAELREVRALAQAPAVAAAQAVAAPTGDARAALRALAKRVRIAVREADAASLRDYALEAERLAPAGDPSWAAYASELAAYSRSVAGPEPGPTTPAATDVRPRLRALAETIRSAEADGNAPLLRDIAREASQLASTASDSKWRTYATQLAEYADSAATAATRRRAAASAPAAAAAAKRAPAAAAPTGERSESKAPERPRRRSASQLANDWDLLGARGSWRARRRRRCREASRRRRRGPHRALRADPSRPRAATRFGGADVRAPSTRAAPPPALRPQARA